MTGSERGPTSPVRDSLKEASHAGLQQYMPLTQEVELMIDTRYRDKGGNWHDEVARVCGNPDCGASLAGERPNKKYCSAKCRQAAYQTQKRLEARSRPASLSDELGSFEALYAHRGYYDWLPHKTTQVMLGRIGVCRTGKYAAHSSSIPQTEGNVFSQYRDQLPLTVRQIYYRMIAEWHYKKGETFENSLYAALVNARRAEMIPFEWIRDDGISGGGYWPADPSEYVNNWVGYAKGYKGDRQVGQERRLQVWCEAAGMVPQLQKVCNAYSLPVYSNGGFSSLTAIRQIVADCLDTGPMLILHLGDCDPSGASIFQAMSQDAIAFLEKDAPGEELLHTERVALTLAQMDQLRAEGIEPDKITTHDKRSQSWKAQGLTEKLELEALAPDEIASRLREAIESHIEGQAYDESISREAADRDLLIGAAEAANTYLRTNQER